MSALRTVGILLIVFGAGLALSAAPFAILQAIAIVALGLFIVGTIAAFALWIAARRADRAIEEDYE
jgi:hypothetical protein